MGGLIGLDYTAVFGVLDAYGVRSRKRRLELLQDLRNIEHGALREMAKRNEK